VPPFARTANIQIPYVSSICEVVSSLTGEKMYALAHKATNKEKDARHLRTLVIIEY
jgi:hypothetical protein